MNVKEIIKCAGKLLDITNVVNYLSGDNTLENVASDDVEKLLTATNIVSSVIASQYIELVDIVNVEVSNKSIYYKDITDKNIIEIKKVYDANDNELNFELLNDKLIVDSQNVKIKYSYFPNELGVNDEINYYTKINLHTFAIGVVSEYLFLKGDFEESFVWDKKFKQAIASSASPKRFVEMPTKRWL